MCDVLHHIESERTKHPIALPTVPGPLGGRMRPIAALPVQRS
jgi:hypothetical protein